MWLPINDFADIRPGDKVTVVLHADLLSSTDTVQENGYYNGRAAVARGRADVVSVRREYAAPAGTLEGELAVQLREAHAELDALRAVVFNAANDLQGLPGKYTELVEVSTQQILNVEDLYPIYRERAGETGSDLRKALPDGYQRRWRS